MMLLRKNANEAHIAIFVKNEPQLSALDRG